MVLFISLVILWLFFIATMAVVDDAEWENLNLVQKIFVALFVIYDVLWNFTGGSIMFLEFADMDRKTLTERLKHILHSGEYEETEWRFKLAIFMCRYLIEPHDFGHCRLGRLIR